MSKPTPTPQPATAAPIRRRDMELIGLAMRNDVDSVDIEDACQRAGLDADTADLHQIDAAVRRAYGQPPPSAWLPWRR